jgi:hypothetical protein
MRGLMMVMFEEKAEPAKPSKESSTVNAELQSRIDELSQTNDDMKSLTLKLLLL